MNSYYNDAVAQKKIDFDNIVLPELISRGFNGQLLREMFDSNRVRLRWGRDWKNFTIHMSNPHGEPTWAADEQVHQLWNNVNVPNNWIMTVFLPAMGRGPISSMALIDLYALADAMKKFGHVHPVRNGHNGQSFMTLPFAHHSIKIIGKYWSVGVQH